MYNPKGLETILFLHQSVGNNETQCCKRFILVKSMIKLYSKISNNNTL